MANLKEIKTRITSIKKTRQITQAMKLVAGAKLKRATDNAMSARPYQQQLSAVLRRVAGSAGDMDQPLLEPRPEVRAIQVVVLTSDRGLCGGFNNVLLRQVETFLQEKRDAGLDISLSVYGRKGSGFLSHRGWNFDSEVVNYSGTPKMDLVRPLCEHMVSGFVDGRFDESYLVYNEFVSTLTQRPNFRLMLPLAMSADDDAAPGGDYRYEPDAEQILGALLPLYIRTLVLQGFLETEAGEYAARMTAMDSATRNASDLIDSLTLDYNRARQAAITTEIIEIVSGAEAL